jgi:hypothetical protein
LKGRTGLDTQLFSEDLLAGVMPAQRCSAFALAADSSQGFRPLGMFADLDRDISACDTLRKDGGLSRRKTVETSVNLGIP